MDIGARLKSERLRLGLSQATIGAIGGVEVNAQRRYENGTRFPRADYLALIAQSGVDVLFVITGMRTESGIADKAFEALDHAMKCLETARGQIH